MTKFEVWYLRGGLTWLALGVIILVVLLWSGGLSHAEGSTDVVEALRAQIVPLPGMLANYGIPLVLENTRQFIDWYYTITLSPEETEVIQEALLLLPAPCCNDNPMTTCCCECNLARSVWGLSAYLIHDKGFGEEEVQAAALRWLQFARGDYYIARALEERGISPLQYGLTTFGSCYRDMCELPLTKGGCAGMNELVEPEPPVVVLAPSDAFALIQANHNNPEFVILDVRTPEEFARGHIAGSINLDYYASGFQQELDQLDQSNTCLVYCRSAQLSGMTARIMEELGFMRIYDLDGGILLWQEAGLPLEQ